MASKQMVKLMRDSFALARGDRFQEQVLRIEALVASSPEAAQRKLAKLAAPANGETNG